jgi:hypothetical protein
MPTACKNIQVMVRKPLFCPQFTKSIQVMEKKQPLRQQSRLVPRKIGGDVYTVSVKVYNYRL